MQAGLFIGSQRSSGNVDYLRSLNITHILSIGVDTLHPTVPTTNGGVIAVGVRVLRLI